MDSKIKIAEDFLKSLEDSKTTVDLMNERMDSKLLYVIHNYAELISKARDRMDVSEKDIIASAMIMGFLLKGHMDRYELEKKLNGLSIDDI